MWVYHRGFTQPDLPRRVLDVMKSASRNQHDITTWYCVGSRSLYPHLNIGNPFETEGATIVTQGLAIGPAMSGSGGRRQTMDGLEAGFILLSPPVILVSNQLGSIALPFRKESSAVGWKVAAMRKVRFSFFPTWSLPL